jgi:cytochrome c-type biogenesis protein CcmH/NrfG
MNDTEMVTELATEVTPDVDIEVTPDVAKRAAKMEQLKRARESGVNKKAKRERDYDDMSSKLDKLTEFMSTKKEQTAIEEPAQKRVRVTKDDVEPQSKESWVTAITRVTAVAALSAGGWYFQHVYGKPSVPQVFKKKEEQKTAAPMLSNNTKNRLIVGKSGFVS